MRIRLGIGATIPAILNLIRSFDHKKAKWFRFLSLVLTVFKLCAFYYDRAIRVDNEDWGGLTDIMSTMSKTLWVCAFASIIINAISLFRRKREQASN